MILRPDVLLSANSCCQVWLLVSAGRLSCVYTAPKISDLSIASCVVDWTPLKPLGMDSLIYVLQLQHISNRDLDYHEASCVLVVVVHWTSATNWLPAVVVHWTSATKWLPVVVVHWTCATKWLHVVVVHWTCATKWLHVHCVSKKSSPLGLSW